MTMAHFKAILLMNHLIIHLLNTSNLEGIQYLRVRHEKGLKNVKCPLMAKVK